MWEEDPTVATPVQVGTRQAGSTAEPRRSTTTVGSQDEIRRQNLGALLRIVHLHGPTSRAELGARLGLNRSTIGALATDLARGGLIGEDVPIGTGRPGRPSLVVRSRSTEVYALALSIEANRLRAARVGLGGRILDLRETGRPPAMRPGETADALAALVRDVQRDAPDETFCAGGGIAIADAAGTSSADWSAATFGAALDTALGVGQTGGPGFVLGDMADAAALAEHTRGVAAGVDDLIYLHGDRGISAGLIAGGRVITGHGGRSGKVGHMVVNPFGAPCGCGSSGCWETEAGERALLRRAGRPAGPGAVRRVLDAATTGDDRAQAALRHVGEWLGFGVANLVNVFSPGMVVFGGTLREVYLGAADVVRQRFDSMALPAAREHLHLRAAELGGDAALLGAAELGFERLLADPLNTPAADRDAWQRIHTRT
ncbi:ROK family protein [Micromonosporaceae bacterium Da 78-11]